MSTLMKIIWNLINEEILKFAQKDKKEFPHIPVIGMLAIWCKQKNLSFSKFDKLYGASESYFELSIPIKEISKSCQHMYSKGRKANTQCTTKVKGDVGYCSRNKR